MCIFIILPLNSLDEVEAGLLLSKFSIENIPEELVDDDSMMTNRLRLLICQGGKFRGKRGEKATPPLRRIGDDKKASHAENIV